jgi:hypothetical protein
MLTISKTEELELFAHLSRTPELRKWLEYKLEIELRVLVANNDVDQLRKAQGKAQLLQQIIELLDVSPAALQKKR